MNLHRALVMALIGLVVLSGVLIIFSIWGIGIEPDVIFKILATLGILILIIGFLLVVKMDFGEHKRLKDNDFID
jgi:hypothetical protein